VSSSRRIRGLRRIIAVKIGLYLILAVASAISLQYLINLYTSGRMMLLISSINLVNYPYVSMFILILGIIVPMVAALYIIAYSISKISSKIGETLETGGDKIIDEVGIIRDKLDEISVAIDKLGRQLDEFRDEFKKINGLKAELDKLSLPTSNEDINIRGEVEIDKSRVKLLGEESDKRGSLKRDIEALKELIGGVRRLREELRKLKDNI